MVFGGSRSLNGVSFSPTLAQCPVVIQRLRVPKLFQLK